MRKAIVCAAICSFTVSGPVAAQDAGGVVHETWKLFGENLLGYSRLGSAVAIDEAIIAAGAPDYWVHAHLTGAVYVFDAITGQQTSFITVPEDERGQLAFGHSVALLGNTLLIGAPETNSGVPESGAAHLYDAASGARLFKLEAEDRSSWDNFGISVALSEHYAFVGVPNDEDEGRPGTDDVGSVYVFDVATGAQVRRITADDGEREDRFGWSISVFENTLLVGAPNDDDNGKYAGSAYVIDASTGQVLHKLLPEGGDEGDVFGVSVALSGSLAVIGAARDDTNGDRAGAAYLFDVATGTQIAKLLVEPDEGTREFGWAVGISGHRAVVGSGAMPETRDGVAYVFDARSGEQLARLLPRSDAWPGVFGNSVAVDGARAVVGSPFDSEAVDIGGSVYLFDVAGDDCQADWDGNGAVNAADVGAFLSDYFLDLLNGTLVADFNEDGVVNAADVGAFLSEYFPDQGACP